MDDLLADFLTETNESLAELDLALVTLERTPDDAETLSQIFRLVHTIKGTCGFLGLPRLERVAHAAENVLGKVRDHIAGGDPRHGQPGADRRSTGSRRSSPDSAVAGSEPAGDDAALIATLERGRRRRGDRCCAAHRRPGSRRGRGRSREAGRICAGEAEEPQADEPAAEAAPPVAAAGRCSRAAMRRRSRRPQTIRVTVDVLEDLMTLVSELVLTRNQLLQLARTQENGGFTVPLQRLSHITSDLQEGVMKTRMQPIGNAWNKLPRLVRDLARETGKKIELTMLGAETELDRQVLELIKDPLTHMVRNSRRPRAGDARRSGAPPASRRPAASR